MSWLQDAMILRCHDPALSATASQLKIQITPANSHLQPFTSLSDSVPLGYGSAIDECRSHDRKILNQIQGFFFLMIRIA